MADGSASAATVTPATRSRRALGTRYSGSCPDTGTARVSSGSGSAGRNGDDSPYASGAGSSCISPPLAVERGDRAIQGPDHQIPLGERGAEGMPAGPGPMMLAVLSGDR